jgi:hypothetical protein
MVLPALFRLVRCIVTATAKTGRVGPDTARLRFFFPLSELVDNEVLRCWAKEFKEKHPELNMDPGVIHPIQLIFTARPIFEGCSDPVPPEGRVAILEGSAKYYGYSFARYQPPEPIKSNGYHIPIKKVMCHDLPEEAWEMTARDAGKGVCPIDTSRKAQKIIKHCVFEALEGCPKPGGKSRHDTFRDAGWALACLVSEGELTQEVAEKAYWKAAEGINNSDKAWTAAKIAEQLKGAFDRVGRRG